MKKIFAGIVLLFLFLFSTNSQDASSSMEAFSSAFDAFRRGEYQNAATAFMRLTQDESKNTLAPESLFMAAQSYFNAADYPTAYSTCEEFLQKYPTHAKIADIEYQLGRILFKTQDYRGAIASFDRFMGKYSTNPLAPSALFWKAESNYQMGNIADSYPLFNEVIARWPESEKASLARWRLNVMGLEVREAKLIRIVEYENQEKESLDIYRFKNDAIREDRYFKWYTAYMRARQLLQTNSLTQADAAMIAKNLRLSVLLDAKQKALNLLISRIMEYLKGFSQ